MIDESKVDDIFTAFLKTGNGSDDIRQIYETLPYLDHDQQRVLTLINALSEKYDSNVLREISKSIHNYAKNNRKAGFSFTKRLEAYSLYKHFNGFRMTGNPGDETK